MEERLKPCPLCGSTDIALLAEEYGDSYDGVPIFRAAVGCRGCREEGCDPDYEAEPCFGIEAYFRTDHPLLRDLEDPWDVEQVLERHMAERWNRRAGDSALLAIVDEMDEYEVLRECVEGRDVGDFARRLRAALGMTDYA